MSDLFGALSIFCYNNLKVYSVYKGFVKLIITMCSACMHKRGEN